MNTYEVSISPRSFWADDEDHAIEQFLDMLGLYVAEDELDTLDSAVFARQDAANALVDWLEVETA